MSRVLRFSREPVWACAKLPEPLALASLGRFRMDGHARDLRKALFDLILEPRGDVMNHRNRQIAIHGTVAGEVNPPLDPLSMNFGAILQCLKFAAQPLHKRLHLAGQSIEIPGRTVDSRYMGAQWLDRKI